MKVIVVEHDARLRAKVADALRVEGHAVTPVAACDDALRVLQDEGADIVLCDIGYPGTPGLEFLTECRAAEADLLVIMTGPRGDDAAALESMQRGAYDFIPKPFRIDHALLVVRKAVEQEALRREVQRLRDELERARTGAQRPPSATDEAQRPTPSRPVAVPPGTVTPGSVLVRTPASVTAVTPGSIGRIDEDLSVKRRKAALERTLIRRALERTGGNRTRAARLLDLSHRALLYKIREYGLSS